MAKTNPNGANQYQLDPRQKMCWDFYIDPKSETFSNAYQSSVKAGYNEGYASTITDVEWFAEKSRTMNMVDKAERVLNNVLEMDDNFTFEDPQRLKIQVDVAKFVAERVGKARYSTKVETDITSGGQILNIQISEVIAKKNELNAKDDSNTSPKPDSSGHPQV